MAPSRLAIVGGGISGLVLATALAERGIRAEIYEQAAHFGEIGAGIAFGANAIRAMRYCSPKVVQAFEAVATQNLSLAYEGKWFDFVDGYHNDMQAPNGETWMFDLTTPERGSAHRAHFLDELIKHAPKDIAHFGKHLDSISEEKGGSLLMKFQDGSSASVDAVIGCDGIKSKVRQVLFGTEHPCVHPRYTHKYAYRGLVPMDRAVSLLGHDKAANGHMHLGHGGHILTFPVAKGKVMNVVAFRQDDGDWPSESKLTLPSQKEHALEDYKDWGETPLKIIKMLEPELDRWGIFDTGSYPCPQFNRGRICLLGDAAHATSPHHGAGAGMCVEDAAVMALILAQAKTGPDFETAFSVFDAQRRERGQWLVQSSRITGDIYDWMDPHCGSDSEKIKKELDWRTDKIWNVDTDAMMADAESAMKKALSVTKGHNIARI